MQSKRERLKAKPAELGEMQDSFNPLNYPSLFIQPRRLTGFSAWHEHLPAAMLLVDLLRPAIFVELGTHYGDSYCAFCQAIQELGLRTHCYAVDTWEGDPQTGLYGPEVLADLRAHHDRLYGSFSTLIQSTFDEALDHFSDRTIDLLHIDGYHTYETVKHDFECWFPKLSARGVVLLHDINVRERDFGVWRLWEELESRYPHLEFTHGHGLGLLAVGQDQPGAFKELLAASVEEKIRIGNLLFQLGHRLELEARVTAQGVGEERTKQSLASEVAEKEQRLQSLASEVVEKGQKAQNLAIQVAEKERNVQALNAQLAEKDRLIQALQQTIVEQTGHLDALVARIEFLSSRDSELRALLLDVHNQLAARDNEIERLRHEGAPPSHGVEAARKHIEYQKLIGRIRKVVRDTLPTEARVIVVSKGDDKLLSLDGRMGWHFPQTEDGTYAGYYPADSTAAIAHLEALRAKGGEYFLIPHTAFWWLDYYAEFKHYLERRYKEIVRDENACHIISLRERVARRKLATGSPSGSKKRGTKPKR
jgi:hypothetical protein